MEERTKVIGFNELKVGMIISKNLEHNGKILLKKDFAITEEMIKKLQESYFIESVEVYDRNIEKKQSNKEEQYNKVEEEFTELASKMQSVFIQLTNKNGIVMNEIREFAQKIQDELSLKHIVIKNIVLHGSGSDVIYRHGVNVAALSSLLGSWIGLEKVQLNLLVYSAILHDFGKTKIDSIELLNKETFLTENEFNVVKTHTTLGYKIINEIPFLDKTVSYGALMHHERLDGSGYPLGLKGDSIHLFAKIIAIADVFDAINSNRVYRKKKLPFEALQIVKDESLGKLDYEYANIFLEHIITYYTGEEVLLNTNEKCKIIQMNINNLEKPLILKDGQFIDLEKENKLYIKEIIK